MATDKQYKHDLRRDIFDLKKGEKVLDRWPELAEYPDLVTHGSGANDLLLRYCILLTDPGSGYLNIANIELRHQKAWAAVGLAATDERQQAAFDFTDVGVAAMSYALLDEGDSIMLAYVLAAEAVLWRDIKKMRNPDGELDDDIPSQIRALKDEKRALFGGDKGLENSVKVSAKPASSLTAEQLARETIKRDR